MLGHALMLIKEFVSGISLKKIFIMVLLYSAKQKTLTHFRSALIYCL